MSKTFLPSHDIEAEMSALGSMILSDRVCLQLCRDMEASDFFRPAHGLIFESLKKLVKRGGIDPIMLRAQLIEDGSFTEAGGMDYIIQLAEFVPSAANGIRYAEIVKSKRVQRDMLHESERLSEVAFDSDAEGNDARFQLWVESFNSVRASYSRSSKIPPSLQDIFKGLDGEICDAFEGKSESGSGFSCGFPTLDSVFGGFFPGDQVVIGGYSGDGKTAFAFESVIRSATISNEPWLFISCEMTKEDILRRFIQSRTGISVIDQRQGKIDGLQYQEISEVMEEFHKLPVYIVDQKSSMDQVSAMALKIRNQFGCFGGIAIDYLQLFKNQQPKKNRTWSDAEDLNAIVDTMKDMAKELKGTTVILSQFNRASQKEDRAPKLEDLKGSGGIENSADVVLLLHRSGKDEAREGKEQAHVHIAKARFARPTKVTLNFTPSRVLWSELSE